MYDGSEDPQSSAESRQILATLGQISKSVEEIKESTEGIKRLEQSTAILTQRIQVLTQEQAQTSDMINVLRNQIAQLTDLQQKALRLQEQQLQEARLTRIASEKTALETRRLREIAERQEREQMRQNTLKAFWYSVYEGTRQAQECNDSLVKQALLLALEKHASNSRITVYELNSVPDKVFAGDTKRNLEDLVHQLSSNPLTQSELNGFITLRSSWKNTLSAIEQLEKTIEQLVSSISELTGLINNKSAALQKERGMVGRFFYGNFSKSRHERQLKEARGKLIEYQAKKIEDQAELRREKIAIDSTKRLLKNIETNHPSISAFQPWSHPYIEL